MSLLSPCTQDSCPVKDNCLRYLIHVSHKNRGSTDYQTYVLPDKIGIDCEVYIPIYDKWTPAPLLKRDTISHEADNPSGGEQLPQV